MLPGLVFLPAFSLLLLAFAIGSSTIERTFAKPFLVLLGESSYALYLLHVIVWTWLFHYARVPFNAVTYILYLLAAVGISIACYRYLEVPARQWLLRVFHQRSKESEAAASIAQ